MTTSKLSSSQIIAQNVRKMLDNYTDVITQTYESNKYVIPQVDENTKCFHPDRFYRLCYHQAR
jgi:hypothetical protein